MRYNWKNGNMNEWIWKYGFHNGVFSEDCGRSVRKHYNPDYNNWTPLQKPKVITNADRIRSMSDEEMAKELIEMIMELCEDGIPSYDFTLEWLRRKR